MKISFSVRPCVPYEQLERNVASAKARGLPYTSEKARPALAVIGGGPSLAFHVDELKAWEGDVWACGSAYRWCFDNGIDATFFNVDPLPEQAIYAKGAERGILASTTDPSVFDEVKSIELFDLIAAPGYVNHGVTAVTCTPCLALEMGYKKVMFFGCESSFEKSTHSYKNEFVDPNVTNHLIWVKSGEEVFVSRPDFLMQAELLAPVIRMAPHVFEERSGGLLGAMVASGDYDIVSANAAMHSNLAIKVEGEVVDAAKAKEILPLLEIPA